MDIKLKVGQRIKNIRLSKGYSQELFAVKCGIDRAYLSKIENGLKNPSLKTLAVILKNLETSFLEFFNSNNFKKVG